MQVVVLHNQSLLDLALQHTGTIESIFELAMLNNLSITDDVVAGKILTIPTETFTNNDILTVVSSIPTNQFRKICLHFST